MHESMQPDLLGVSRLLRCRCAAAARPFIRRALADAPRFVARGEISADLSTPGGTAQALSCLSLWRAGAIGLRHGQVSGAKGGSGPSSIFAIDGPSAHLPDSGVFTARVAGSGESSAPAAETQHTRPAGNGGGTAVDGPVLSAGSGKSGNAAATLEVEGSLQLPGEMFEDLLDQLQGQWRGRRDERVGSPVWGRGRPAMMATSELWQMQVVEAMSAAGVSLNVVQLKRWQAVGLPGGDLLRSRSDGGCVGGRTPAESGG